MFQKAAFSTIYVDPYFKNVLESVETRRINKIEVAKDGSWKVSESTATNMTIITLEDDDMENSQQINTLTNYSPNLSLSTAGPSLQSDNMQTRFNKKRKEETKVRDFKRVKSILSSTTPSNLSSVEMITLDSENVDENGSVVLDLFKDHEIKTAFIEVPETNALSLPNDDRIDVSQCELLEISPIQVAETNFLSNNGLIEVAATSSSQMIFSVQAPQTNDVPLSASNFPFPFLFIRPTSDNANDNHLENASRGSQDTKNTEKN